MCLVLVLSHVCLFAAPWTVACHVPLSTGFSRQVSILEWVAMPSCRGSSQPQEACVSCTDRQTVHQWATWEALNICLRYEHYGEMNFVVVSNYFKDSHIINQKSTQMFWLGTNGTLIKMKVLGKNPFLLKNHGQSREQLTMIIYPFYSAFSYKVFRKTSCFLSSLPKMSGYFWWYNLLISRIKWTWGKNVLHPCWTFLFYRNKQTFAVHLKPLQCCVTIVSQ